MAKEYEYEREKKMKRIFILILSFGLLLSLQSCVLSAIIAYVAENYLNAGDRCFVSLANNSDSLVFVGCQTVSAHPKTNKELRDTMFMYIGDVYAHSETELGLWYVYKERVNWAAFFAEYEIDTLSVVVANSLDAVLQWERQKSDSLLLRKYKFALGDLDRLHNEVRISYP